MPLDADDDACLSGLDDELVVACASYLPPEDMARTAMVSRRLRTLTERSARRHYDSSPADLRSNLPRYHDGGVEGRGESWIRLYRHVLGHASPLEFDTILGLGILYAHECNPLHLAEDRSRLSTYEGCHTATAICGGRVMRAGRHYAAFDFASDGGRREAGHFGIVRPMAGKTWTGKDVGGVPTDDFTPFLLTNVASALRQDGRGNDVKWGRCNIFACTLYFDRDRMGDVNWVVWNACDDVTSEAFIRNDPDWWDRNNNNSDDEDEEDEEDEEGGRSRLGTSFGFLLDLDEGTLSLYKDGVNHGVMKTGLGGEFCWMTCTTFWDKYTDIRIRREDVPDCFMPVNQMSHGPDG